MSNKNFKYSSDIFAEQREINSITLFIGIHILNKFSFKIYNLIRFFNTKFKFAL